MPFTLISMPFTAFKNEDAEKYNCFIGFAFIVSTLVIPRSVFI
jgi:hypothetical protein